MNAENDQSNLNALPESPEARGSARAVAGCQECNYGKWIATGGGCYCVWCGLGLEKPERYWHAQEKQYLYRPAPNS